MACWSGATKYPDDTWAIKIMDVPTCKKTKHHKRVRQATFTAFPLRLSNEWYQHFQLIILLLFT